MIISLALACLTAISATKVPSVKYEEDFKDYFESREPFLHEPAKHGAFRTMEEHDMSNYWGFFRLPAKDELIQSSGDILCQYCNGEGIYSLSRLLSYTLETVFESLSSLVDDQYRLGFFKMFPNRTSYRLDDAYLHFVNGGGRIKITASEASGSREVFFKAFYDLCQFLSDSYIWSDSVVGFTVELPAKELLFEIWTSPDMSFEMLRKLKAHLEELRVATSAEEGREDLQFQVDYPEVIEPNDSMVSEVRSKFLAPISVLEPEASEPLRSEVLMFAAAFPQTSKGDYEKARLVERRNSLITNTCQLKQVLNEKLMKFPGTLSKNSYLGVLKRDTLQPEQLDLMLGCDLFNINYCPAVHTPKKITLSGCSTYSGYAELARLTVMYFVTGPMAHVDAVFIHFNADARNPSPKASKLDIELWTKKGARLNQLNGIRTGLFEYISANFEQ